MKQSRLTIDTGLKTKSKDDFYPSKGKTYSFKIMIGNRVFYSMSMYGNDGAIDRAKEQVLNDWPDKPELEVI